METYTNEEIDHLVEELELYGELADYDPRVPTTIGKTLREAAKVIKILWGNCHSESIK